MVRFRTTLLLVSWLLLLFAAPAGSVEVGDLLPDFSTRTLEGYPVSTADLLGSPVLLVFWNTWCANCRRELPEIDRVAAAYGPRGLKLLAINTGYNDSEEKARAYWKKFAHVFPSGFDHRFEIGQNFGIRGVPTVYLIDGKGIVRYKQAVVPRDMEEQFQQLANPEGKPQKPAPTPNKIR